MIAYPNIDPVIFEIGPFALRWYALAYVVGIVAGCCYADWLNKKPPVQTTLRVFDDFMVWAIIGIIAGGRLGYVLFYNLNYYIYHPFAALQVWHGGMSFHGGFLGVVIAMVLFCKKYKVSTWALFDLAACTAPIGIFLGRMANFINGELYGRVTDVSWAMIFPDGGSFPRHPSQIYEAFLEGILLFIIQFIIVRFTAAKSKAGIMSGIFLSGYAISRMLVENFREPDTHIGFFFGHITTGQLLSFPMLLAGVIIVFISVRKRHVT